MKLTLQFDENSLNSYTDDYLASLWSAAQACDAPAEDRDTCRVVELIGREIISRWLKNTPPRLWSRQGSHAYSLPKIDSDAKVRAVIDAAREVVATDHGSTLLSHRNAAMLAVDKLDLAIANLPDPKSL